VDILGKKILFFFKCWGVNFSGLQESTLGRAKIDFSRKKKLAKCKGYANAMQIIHKHEQTIHKHKIKMFNQLPNQK